MKQFTVALALAVLFELALANSASAQATKFAMVGFTANDTLQLNLVAYPPTPATRV